MFRAARYGFNIGFATSLLGRIAAPAGSTSTTRVPRSRRLGREFVAAELPEDVLRADAWAAEAAALVG